MVGEKLGSRYEILEKVGDGGMALVYRAKDTLLNRIVAVKVLRAQFASDDEFIERFRREAQAAASLSHPNVVNIYDVGQTEEVHYIVMEYVEGQNLSDLIKAKGALSEHIVVSIAHQISKALAHAHNHKIIHRDIKPHNILITADGRVKVTDFGIAQAMSSSNLTQTGVVLGSVHYFSPEQARGVNVQLASDLYSLGIVMYEMLVGKQPFRGDTPISIALKQIQEDPTPPRQYNPELHPRLEQLVLQLLAKDPHHRPQDAVEVVRTLQTIERELGTLELDNSLDDEQTTVLLASDIQDKEVVGLARGKRKKKKQQKKNTRKWPAVVVILLLLAIVIWGTVELIPRFLFPDDAIVPNIIGEEVTRGDILARMEGLALVVENEVYDNNIPANHIISQEPSPGRVVKQGRQINVRVSRGMQEMDMPSVEGLFSREARLNLTQAGFPIGEEIEVFDSEAPINTVIEQIPAPGEWVQTGMPVTLVVSRGAEVPESVRLPDFSGQSLEEARAEVARLGLGEGNIWSEYSTIYSQGQIVEQNPSAGTEVELGEPIHFVYSQGMPQDSTSVPSQPQEPERWTAETQWQVLEVTINVPDGPAWQEVVILIIDDFGAREVYREMHEANTRIVRSVQGRGEDARLQVYIGARIFRDQLFSE